MEKYSAEEIASITDEIYNLKNLFKNDIDMEMHLSCNILIKNFQNINSGYDKVQKLEEYNNGFKKLKNDTANICVTVERAIAIAENDSNW